MKTYVYSVQNSLNDLLDGIVFRNRNEASHAIHMVCDELHVRNFNLMSRTRYNNWLSKIVKGYWNGYYDKKEADTQLIKELEGQTKYNLYDVWCTAQYWDFFGMFHIDEQPIVDDMNRLKVNIKNIMKSNKW